MTRLAAAAERASEHPIARAVLAEAARRRLAVPPASDFRATPGRGVAATVAGHAVTVVRPEAVDRSELASAADRELATLVERGERAGHTSVVVTVDGRATGVLAVADRVRPAAAPAVAQVARLTSRPPILLTGDNEHAARRLAHTLGIDDVRAGLLPEAKLAAIEALQARGERVLVVGDGVNDTPALAAADVGVALGRAGTDQAIDVSDAIIFRDRLDSIPALLALATRARRLTHQNLAIAATGIITLTAWDLAGDLPLALGVAGHEGSTVLVALNGLRLLHSKRPAGPPATTPPDRHP